MLVWMVAAGIVVLCGAVLARALSGAGALPAAEGAGPGDVLGAGKDLAVYRAQMDGIGRDLDRGVIDETEAGRLRVEIAQRILAADRARRAGSAGAAGGDAPGGTAVRVAVVAVGLALAASLGLYRYLGAPDLADRPIARRIAEAEALRRDRPDQAAAEAEALAAGALPAPSEPDPAYGELIGRLRDAVAERPDDLQGQQLLMRHEASLGNFAAAAAAQSRVVALMGAGAQADDHAALAELLVMAAAGYVAPEAEAALAAALARDPGHGSARYYLGLLEAQTGRPDRAFRLWRDLLEEGPETAPWVAPIREQIDILAAAAGVRYQPPEAVQPPEALAGPDADAIAAAGAMSAEDRDAMIRGMVDRLGTRLAEAGGTPAEWARLITALGVLGETDRARATYAEARDGFAGQDAALAELRVAAEAAGVAE